MDPTRVDRLHRCLARALESRGHAAADPVTVAEIADELVPYALVRSELDVDLKADYEHVLLQLLAEAEEIRLEPEEAREALRKELRSPHPDVGIFRRFPSSRVWVGPASEGPESEHEPIVTPEPIQPDAVPVTEVTTEAEMVRAAHREPSAVPEAGTRCPHCGEPLPTGREVRFCPHCGRDPEERPCPQCGATTEPSWRFCVDCGAPTGGR